MSQTSHSYDIIIPLAKKDLSFVGRVVKYMRKNLPEAQVIYLITKQAHAKYLKHLTEQKDIVLLDEDSLFDGLSYQAVRDLLASRGLNTGRTGWYLQQFLEFAFGMSSYAKEYFLSWDSDTIPLRHISFFDGDKPLFTMKSEYHKEYFLTLKNLLGIDRQTDQSFIAEHMMFNTKVMREIVSGFSAYNKEYPWFKNVIDALVITGRGNYFADFETYGSWCYAKHPGLYGTQQLNTFRRAGMIRGRKITDGQLAEFSVDLDIASFEEYDAPFPYNIKYLWKKVSRTRIVDLPGKIIGHFKKTRDAEALYAALHE